MHYRRMGDCGLKISAVALGSWKNFGTGRVADDTVRTIIETAYAQGINFFDTADMYGVGRAEEQMGQIFRQYPRHSLVVATKVYWPMSEGVNDRGLSRKHIMESIDKSLRRLGMDYIDIYFCHRPDSETPIRETVMAMHTIIEQGKALYWGTSEWHPAQIVEAYELCKQYGWHLPQVEQPEYSMLKREPVEGQVLPVTAPRGIGLVVWSPLGMGMLTGKYDAGVPLDSRFGREEKWQQRFITEANLARVRGLKTIADELGITRSQLALAWVLRHQGVSSAIIGATQAQQVMQNVKAADITLPDDVVDSIERILGES